MTQPLFDGAIFVDVGGHTGQTLDEVTRPKYAFRTIFCLEPMPRQFTHLLRAYRSFDNVQVLDYGLGDSTRTATIYGSNERFESSIFADKNDVATIDQTECVIVDATNWFSRNTTEDDTIIVKLNCEGSEVPILDNLIDSGMIHRIHNVMVDWDARKIPSIAHREQDLLVKMADVGFDRYSLCDNVMRGLTHQDRIGNWLSTLV